MSETQVTVLASKPVTAGEVRAHFQGNESALSALSEAAQHTVKSGARGRIHPEARDAFNEGRKPSEQYNEGAPRTVALTYRRVTSSGSRNRKVFVPESEARGLAGEVAGERGPLSKAAREAAGERLAEILNA